MANHLYYGDNLDILRSQIKDLTFPDSIGFSGKTSSH
jgi:hypothetical protein